MWIITSYEKETPTNSRLVLSSQENILESDNTNELLIYGIISLLVIVLRRLAPDDV